MQCIVSTCGCNYRINITSVKDVTFFVFPQQRSLRERWLQALGIQDWQPIESSVVCSNHFLKEDLYMTRSGMQRLRAGAVPVLQTTLDRNQSMNVNQRYNPDLCTTHNKRDNCQIEIINIKIENAHIHEQSELEAVYNMHDNGMSKLKTIKNEDTTTDVMNLHNNIDTNDVKRVDYQVINKNVCYNASSGWLEVSVPALKAEDSAPSDDTNPLCSYEYQVDVKVKRELCGNKAISAKVERDSDNCGTSVSNIDILCDNMSHGETIGIDCSSDVSLSRGREKAIQSSHRAVRGARISKDRHRQRQPQTQGAVERKYNLPCHLASYNVAKPSNCSQSRFNKKPYVCNVCKKVYRVETKFNNHLRIHSGEKPYTCLKCNKGFFDSVNLKHHSSTHSNKKPHSCGVCKKTFPCSSGLQRHMIIHTGDKPYSCHICKKRFNANCNLQKHLRLHSGEKPYPCNICQKTFSESGHLLNHLRNHSGEKPYSCDVCEKRFTIKSALPRHLKIHTGAKPYLCNICKKTFNEKYNLHRHLRVHSGEKPYPCDVCEKLFSDKGNLLKHKRQCNKKLM